MNKFFLYGLPISGIIIICFVWFEIYKPKVVDDWYSGVMLVDSGYKSTDPTIKKNLLASGGQILRQQLDLHPYHARIWFMYGYYFLANNNWDSCIYAEKKAIEIGAGGTVNQVEYSASEQLNYALERKLNDVHTLDSSISLINNASTNNFENNALNKFKGLTYFRYNQIDSSNVYFERFCLKNPNDFDVLRLLAFNYYNKGMKDKSLYYAKQAQKIKGDNSEVNNLINQLNSGI